MGCKQASSDGNDEADSSELIGDSVRPPSFANDDEMLDFIQRVHLNYMWDGAEANSGLARERIHLDGNYPEHDEDIVTTGGSGFGIAGLL